mmetsp:Transcript_36594/g.81292  ORF Transcript_36594/g.81292 Transcript_36594/m.81292 type:complete len:541 (+) Transcript_36594:233-1855(+)
MGNAVGKKFDLPGAHTATAGHLGNWRIWPGRSKETGSLVSVWAFDKTDLSKRKSAVTDKALLEQVFQIMKRDFGTLKDCKCAYILQVIEVVEESKAAMAFSTERVVCSLADILDNFERIPGGFGEHASFFEAGASVSEMEVSRGMLAIAQGLQYLHTVQRKLHLDITPHSVVITAAGQWKLCGFGCALAFSQGEQQRLASPYFMQMLPAASVSQVTRLEPDLRYAAPELTEGGYNPPGVRYLSPVADVFSLALLFYEIYRYNLKYCGRERQSHIPLLHLSNNDASQHAAALSTLQGADFSFLPQVLAKLLGSMLGGAMGRAPLQDVVQNPYFATGAQAVLNMVDGLAGRDLGTQSSQLIGLQVELGNIPPRLLIHAILPCVSRLCIDCPGMWVYVLPLHAELSKLLPHDKYVHFSLPYLSQGLSNPDCPTETLQVFLSSAEFLCKTFGADFFQAHVASLLCTALDRPNLFVQHLALEKLSEEYVHSLFSRPTLEEKLMPQLCKVACKNADPEIKMQPCTLSRWSLGSWELTTWPPLYCPP